MANHFKQVQVELERMGFEHDSTNAKGGETWTHPAHKLVIYPGMKEHTHRLILRDVRKALGVKTETNKRKVEQIKDRQAKQRDLNRAEIEARMAWVSARIRDLEMAQSMRALTAQQEHLLMERLAEMRELRSLMSQVPTG